MVTKIKYVECLHLNTQCLTLFSIVTFSEDCIQMK